MRTVLKPFHDSFTRADVVPGQQIGNRSENILDDMARDGLVTRRDLSGVNVDLGDAPIVSDSATDAPVLTSAKAGRRSLKTALEG